MAKQFAARLALIAFAVTLVESLIASKGFQPGLISALARGAFGYVIGLVVGELTRRIVEENAHAEFSRAEEPSAQPATDG